MKKIRLINLLKNFIFIVEMVLAAMILFGVLAGLISTVLQLPHLLTITRDQFYDSFKLFLGNALLLIVGVELIRMLITHTTRATLELIVFVIARKLLIYTDTMTDIFLGTIALAFVFGTIKYLQPTKSASAPTDRFPVWMKLKEISTKLGLDIPNVGEKTIEEFIKSVRVKKTLPVTGEKIDAGPVTLVLGHVSEDGAIHDVEITDSNFVSKQD